MNGSVAATIPLNLKQKLTPQIVAELDLLFKSRYCKTEEKLTFVCCNPQDKYSPRIIQGWTLQPATSSSRLFQGSKGIVLAFAIYGIAAGIVTVIDSMSYEQDIQATLSIIMKIPTAMAFFMILGESFPGSMPVPVWNAVIFAGSVALWTTVGFIVYCFYKLFKLGP